MHWNWLLCNIVRWKQCRRCTRGMGKKVVLNIPNGAENSFSTGNNQTRKPVTTNTYDYSKHCALEMSWLLLASRQPWLPKERNLQNSSHTEHIQQPCLSKQEAPCSRDFGHILALYSTWVRGNNKCSDSVDEQSVGARNQHWTRLPQSLKTTITMFVKHSEH